MLTFETSDLAAKVEKLPLSEIDELPFGAIRLDQNGSVKFYSKRESQLSGFSKRPVLGLNFYADIAPCMNSPKFKGRVQAALVAGALDLEFSHTGDFADRNRTLHVRALSASDGDVWLFIAR